MSNSNSTDDSAHSDTGTGGVERMLEAIDLRDGWQVSDQDERSVTIDFDAVPLSRLARKAPPGIDVLHSGNVWMLMSHDPIGTDFDRDHAGILNHGSTVDCTHFDDAVAAIQNGMVQVEKSVGEELREAHEGRGWPYA